VGLRTFITLYPKLEQKTFFRTKKEKIKV